MHQHDDLASSHSPQPRLDLLLVHVAQQCAQKTRRWAVNVAGHHLSLQHKKRVPCITDRWAVTRRQQVAGQV